MPVPQEYSGLLNAAVLGNNFYRVQRTRLHIHGDAGDVTSSGDRSKARIGTVPDYEVTLTQTSFNPGFNPFNVPFAFGLFSYTSVAIYPGGVAQGILFLDPNGMIDDFELDADANMLNPLMMHIVAAGGGNPTIWYPV